MLNKNIKIATQSAIIVFTTVLFSVLFYREYLALQKYMSYIAENGKSALFHEQYINQRIAFRLSTLFSMPHRSEEVDAVCSKPEHVNGVYGLNLTGNSYKALAGTLQTREANCRRWAQDINAFHAIDGGIFQTSNKYSFSNYGSYIFNNTRYYVDLKNNYIYSAGLVDIRTSPFTYWSHGENPDISLTEYANSLNVNAGELSDFMKGNSITTHIHFDRLVNKSIFSMICPVFEYGQIKGMMVTNISAEDLSTAFYTSSHPVLWRALQLYVKDGASQSRIVFHRPAFTVANVLNDDIPLTQTLTLNVRVDIWYLILSNLWLFALFVLSTLLLLRYSSYQLNRHALLSRDNITDALTGLYNRKVLTESLRHKISGLLQRRIAVTLIALDCDGLKQINDVYGHHAGDKAIALLGKSISRSVRKSDYGIRVGGDEFLMLLIDADAQKANEVVQRVADKLRESDDDGRVSFSWGSYQLEAGENLDIALKEADKRLYQQKQAKKIGR
ncbi:diguanylate cyclase [Pluralibacter gergoviae]